MIARGAFGNPWLFNKKASLNVAEASGLHAGGQADGLHYISPKERLTVALEHAKLFQEKLGEHKSFYIMRKHFKAYASGFDGASELRAKLLETKNITEVEDIVKSFLDTQN
jgi:tRNA-dihydrouridine synthase